MKNLSRKSANVTHVYPERILQFGGGNFLRGFVDWIIDKYNRQSNDEKIGILAVKVRKEGNYNQWAEQDGLYHLFSKGYMKGRTVDEMVLIKSVVRILEVHNEYDEFLKSALNPQLNIIVSNTTETGLAFDSQDKADEIPSTFPGQLCRWLHARWTHFQNDRSGKCVIIPCELVDQNGQVLKNSIFEYINHWDLEDAFKLWLDERVQFCNSLVDRIVPGINQDQLTKYQERTGFIDNMITEGEPYHLWAIETKFDLAQLLPLDRIGLNVVYTKDLTPFKEQKIKILNGAHTAMVPVGLLMGVQLVKDAVNHSALGPFIEKVVFEEITPSIDIERETAEQFGQSVLDRFRNPFLEHKLQSISMYSISKFNVRLKPTIKSYIVHNKTTPKGLMLSFAALLIFYKGDFNGKVYTANDEAEKIEKLTQHWMKINTSGVISAVSIYEMLADEVLWEENLNQISGFPEATAKYLKLILEGKLDQVVTEIGSQSS
ncbi:tagaturonate reductase [Portibacter lacus]|uniref:Altronate oxidoreductase n=1 Tax=Portibacter lacus TaxID=1099794 RepID=A0AA37SP75_9BACT|nr:tagaturonate reductase [Portibacter lacus]GLR17149.1 altronate oxidoreductase [Portibacter lacus]